MKPSVTALVNVDMGTVLDKFEQQHAVNKTLTVCVLVLGIYAAAKYAEAEKYRKKNKKLSDEIEELKLTKGE